MRSTFVITFVLLQWISLYHCTTGWAQSHQLSNTGEKPDKDTPQTTSSHPPQDHNDKIFLVVEQQPEFPGGDIALKEYIAKNLVTPTPKSSGKVFIGFVVNTDGSLQDFEVKKGLSPAQNEEALRLVKTMPKWQPGKQSGKAIRVRYYLPIAFQ